MKKTTRRNAFLILGLAVILVSIAQLHLGSKTPDVHSSKRSFLSPRAVTTTSHSSSTLSITSNGGGFVHIGKTGGSTLSLLLRNGCHSFMKHPCYNISDESPASKLIEKYYHVPDFGLLRQSNHDFYVVTTRDPFDRTISAFVYDHIRNRDARNETIDPLQRERYEAAYVCFPTLEVFAAYLKGNSSDFRYPYHRMEVHPESCRDLARAAFHGHVRLYSHLYFGFERIRSFIPDATNRVFYLVRQERLWEDWININRILETSYALNSQESNYDVPLINRGDRRNTTSLEIHKQLPVGRNLSTLARQSLCRALETEYRAFFWLLRRAVNIDNEQRDYSVTRAKRQCGAYLDLERIIQVASTTA